MNQQSVLGVYLSLTFNVQCPILLSRWVRKHLSDSANLLSSLVLLNKLPLLLIQTLKPNLVSATPCIFHPLQEIQGRKYTRWDLTETLYAGFLWFKTGSSVANLPLIQSGAVTTVWVNTAVDARWGIGGGCGHRIPLLKYQSSSRTGGWYCGAKHS